MFFTFFDSKDDIKLAETLNKIFFRPRIAISDWKLKLRKSFCTFYFLIKAGEHNESSCLCQLQFVLRAQPPPDNLKLLALFLCRDLVGGSQAAVA